VDDGRRGAKALTITPQFTYYGALRNNLLQQDSANGGMIPIYEENADKAF